MNDDRIALELRCRACGRREYVGLARMVDHLRSLGMFKRHRDPDPELIRELYTQQIPLLPCSHCGHVGFGASEAEELDDEQWCGGRVCERCRQPIPVERLEVFPDTRRCAACQQAGEQDEDQGEPEYCPRCGAIMQLRLRGGSGITQYAMRCPECGLGK